MGCPTPVCLPAQVHVVVYGAEQTAVQFLHKNRATIRKLVNECYRESALDPQPLADAHKEKSLLGFFRKFFRWSTTGDVR